MFIALLFLTAGCATTQLKEQLYVKGPTYQIANTPYLPLASIINAYGLDYSWDLIGKRLILYRDDRKVTVCIGSKVALVNGLPKDLSAPTQIYNGVIVLPKDFVSCEINRLFGEKLKSYPEAVVITAPVYSIGKVVIDPGHGGRDPGAIGQCGLREKSITLDIANRLKYYLEKAGIKVMLTRDSDRFISLWRRADMANKEDTDFFISIHANASLSKSIKGFEIYALSEAIDDNSRAVAASENASLEYENSSFAGERPSPSLEATLWDIEYTENREESIELARRINKVVSRDAEARSRGVKTARFYVLKGARIPSILIEVGFISNRKEASLLNKSEYRERLAKAIADGIIAYKIEYDKTEGFTR